VQLFLRGPGLQVKRHPGETAVFYSTRMEPFGWGLKKRALVWGKKILNHYRGQGLKKEGFCRRDDGVKEGPAKGQGRNGIKH